LFEGVHDGCQRTCYGSMYTALPGAMLTETMLGFRPEHPQ
jgi:hypothetical protein